MSHSPHFSLVRSSGTNGFNRRGCPETSSLSSLLPCPVGTVQGTSQWCPGLPFSLCRFPNWKSGLLKIKSKPQYRSNIKGGFFCLQVAPTCKFQVFHRKMCKSYMISRIDFWRTDGNGTEWEAWRTWLWKLQLFFSKMSVFNIYEFLPQEFYLKTETV